MRSFVCAFSFFFLVYRFLVITVDATPTISDEKTEFSDGNSTDEETGLIAVNSTDEETEFIAVNSIDGNTDFIERNSTDEDTDFIARNSTDEETDFIDGNSTEFHNESSVQNELDCDDPEKFAEGSFQMLKNGDVFVNHYNLTYPPSSYKIVNGENLLLCPQDPKLKQLNDSTPHRPIENCETWEYLKIDYQILPNQSVFLAGLVLEEGTYELKENGILLTCAVDYEETELNFTSKPDNETASADDDDMASIYILRIGSTISVLSLISHLLVFCLVPTLRNLPGFNLASLSLALLISYSFALAGQNPDILGTFCVVTAILQYNFFLAAFFWMNVMSFDVWKTLRLATERLVLSSARLKKRRFIWYSLYAWGMPLAITVASVVIDGSQHVPDDFKPQYGKGDVCWIADGHAKIIFFTAPVFTLCVVNAVFLGLSAYMIVNNTMKNSNDQHHSVQLNFVLYARLGVIMGATWLIGVVALCTKGRFLWYVFDVLNSLQGLFVFLLFTCTRKVWRKFHSRTARNSKASWTFKRYSSSDTRSDTR